MNFKLASILGLFFVAATPAELRGGYCDQWTPCGPGYLCHNSACVNLDCN